MHTGEGLGAAKLLSRAWCPILTPSLETRAAGKRGHPRLRSESLHRSAHMEARLTRPTTGPTGDSGAPNYMMAVVDHKSLMKPGAHVDRNTLKSEEEWHVYTKCLL